MKNWNTDDIVNIFVAIIIFGGIASGVMFLVEAISLFDCFMHAVPK